MIIMSSLFIMACYNMSNCFTNLHKYSSESHTRIYTWIINVFSRAVINSIAL